jgi:hypothetical protein
MNKTLLLVWCGLLLISGVSCKDTNTSTPTPLNAPEISSIWSTWLTQTECKPPCWQNITPGITTKDEAVSILEKMSDTTITYDTKSGVDWQFGLTKDEGGWLGAQDGIVNFIVLSAVNSERTLEEVVASYDYPSYVVPDDCRDGMCVTALVYPDLGIFLNVFVENTGWDNDTIQIEILSNTIVDRVYFIEKGMDSFQKNYLIPEDKVPIIKWKGYGDYSED